MSAYRILCWFGLLLVGMIVSAAWNGVPAFSWPRAIGVVALLLLFATLLHLRWDVAPRVGAERRTRRRRKI